MSCTDVSGQDSKGPTQHSEEERTFSTNPISRGGRNKGKSKILFEKLPLKIQIFRILTQFQIFLVFFNIEITCFIATASFGILE